jgi:beta-lactamase superfamily II metal-dependent hydrolase
VMLSPHHGSLNANQPELAAWAQPDHVIVSGGRRDVLPRLRRIYGEGAEVVSTNRSGAVTTEVRPDGSLVHLRPFEPERLTAGTPRSGGFP